MYHSILVPLDGSQFGEHALPWATAIASRAGVPIHLIHVHVPLARVFAESRDGVELPSSVTEVHNAMEYLARTADLVKEKCGVDVSWDVIEGTLPDALFEHTERTRSDLVVMTTHGRGFTRPPALRIIR
jgi:nucleotide-binding universal stress UspA family protein